MWHISVSREAAHAALVMARAASASAERIAFARDAPACLLCHRNDWTATYASGVYAHGTRWCRACSRTWGVGR